MDTGPVPSLTPVDQIIAKSPTMKHAVGLIRLATRSRSNVLIQGETGTGKSAVARAIHRSSKLTEGPLIEVRCSAVTEAELEDQLFSTSEKGFLARSSSTLFIDEIEYVSARLQSRIVRHLETRQAFPRVIAAANCDLSKAIQEGIFREDLFWRLNVIPIAVPPLRRRKEDIELLVLDVLDRLATSDHRVNKIDPDCLAGMREYSWPGNVRELEIYLERAFIMAQTNTLTAELLPTAVMGDRNAAEDAVFRPTDEKSLVHEYVYNRIGKASKDAADLHKQIVEPIEKELLIQILDICNNVQKSAAAKLGINRNTLYKKLKEFGLDKANTKPKDNAD